MDDLRGNLGASYVINNVAAAPHYYERSEVPSASDKTVLTMPEILWLNVANKGYSVDGAVTIDLLNADMWDNSTYITASNRKGKDFYIYACVTSNDTLRYILSANSTVPTGYTADTSRKIGGFHCLCADVGSISGHKLSGYVAGDILPYSVWDLKHRPKSEPEGMVYVPGIDLWVDIYLASWTGTTAAGTLKAVSKYGATTGDGTSTEKFHCWKWEQTMGEQKKRLLYQREFMVASVGSNQGTNVKGSADVNTTGGFSDTAGRRMISNYGIEDMCGNLWQWGADVGSATTGSSSYGNGYDANDRSDIKGQTYGGVYRPLLGGGWNDGAVCGSRGSLWNGGSLYWYARGGGRGASEPLGA